MDGPYDLAVVGGGINGAGIARDAAGRGLSVLLIERDDLASHTSSASSKLIHGGLRYLEHFEFRLVAEALAEREVLLRIAPHVIRPMRFVLPHAPHLRPRWMLRAGLWLYDHMGGRRSLDRSKSIDLRASPFGRPLKPTFTHGFAYSDAWVDDARLVVLNAMSARDKGAQVLTRTECVAARRSTEAWTLRLRDANGEREVRARMLVNATGSWVEHLLGSAGMTSAGKLRLVKGSHIAVPRLYEGEHAYLLQNEDRRVVFMLPYGEGLTAIGTTDIPIESDEPPRAPTISTDEIEYLCAAVSAYTLAPVTPNQVVHTWSGVRALADDGSDNPSAVSRDYELVLNDGGPKLLSVFGGKITTYRKLAEHALKKLGIGRPWTANEPLPGGDFGRESFEAVASTYANRYPRLQRAWLRQLLRRHGTNAAAVLSDAQSEHELGEHFGAGLYEREVRYLIEREWARSAEDIIWRRTKAGLGMSRAQVDRLRSALGAALEAPEVSQR